MGVVGVAIVVGGIVLLPLPGPGWLIIFIGLGVLASEFDWARRLLDFARKRVGKWTEWVRTQGLGRRAGLGLACLAVVAAVVYGYVAWQGVPEWVPGIG